MNQATRRIVEAVVVVLIALLSTLFFTWPLPQQASSHLGELGDSRLNAYIQAWGTHAWTTHPAQLFNPNMYYPTKNALSGSENMLGNQWLFAPVYLLSGNPILATNLVILASFVLSALTMYLLVKAITEEYSAAAVAGFVYGFALPRVAQMNHMQLLSVQWTPLIVLFLYRFLLKQKAIDLLGLFCFVNLQMLSSLYLGYLATLVIACYSAAVVVTRRDLITKRVVAGLALSALLTGVLIIPIGLHYQQWGKNALLTQADLRDWATVTSANPLSSYLEVAGFPNNIYKNLLRRYDSVDFGPEKRLFMGFVPMGLALLGILASWRLRRQGRQALPDASAHKTDPRDLLFAFAVGSFLTIVSAYILSLGPYLRIHDQLSHIRLPYAELQKVVPGMGSFRVPARFGLAVLFGVAALAGLGFAQLMRTRLLDGHQVVRAGLLLVVLLAISAEFKVTPIDLSPVMGPAQVAPEYRWLAAQRPGSVTLELPIGGPPGSPDPYEEAGYVYASVYHWQPLMNGYTGNPPLAFSQTLRLAGQMPDPAAVDSLARLGLRYVLVHLDRLAAPDAERWRSAAAASRLHEAARFEDGAAVYEVIRPDSAQDEQ